MIGIPYYVWRRSTRTQPTVPEPRRRQADNTVLRKSFKIPHLSRSEAETTYLFKSQITICLTGFHEKRWTATCLVDSREAQHTVKHYHEGGPDGFDQNTDPISLGEINFKEIHPVQNPRLYFLRVWTIWLTYAERKWGGTVFRIEQIAKE